MITITQKGNFSKIEDFIEKMRKKSRIGYQATEIAEICVAELKAATPVDSGLTASSWYYEINTTKKETTITFSNRNIQNGVNVVLLLEYGHGTSTGGWIEGKDFVEPVIQERYSEIINNKWKELTKI